MEDILERLVAIPTVTGDRPAADEALGYAAEFVAKRGMDVQWHESGGLPSLTASAEPDNKTPKVLLAAHMDVVPAPDELFKLRKESDKLYGRGVLDMKYAIAAYLQTIHELGDDVPNYDLGLMLTSDEETGGQHGTGALVEQGYRPDVCVLPDGGDDWQIQTFAKGVSFVNFAAEGRSAHSARPWLGDNAIMKLVNLIPEVAALFPESHDNSNTQSLNQISGGRAPNQVPDHAEAVFDIRALSEAEKSRLLSAAGQLACQHNAAMSVLIDGATCNFSLDDPLIAPFAEAISDVSGTVVAGSRTCGTSDLRYLAEHHIPSISVYPPGGGHHGPDEWLSRRGFHDFQKILRRYLETVAKR
jgi:acetylornithine deacetylase/succinyl-diaminopimelate desuccinylase-like protein